MRVNILWLFVLASFIILSISISQGSIDTKDYENKDVDYVTSKERFNEATQPKEKDYGGGSSRDVIVTSGPALPVNILSEIIKPKRDGDFFINEPIEVLVEITARKEGGLKQIEFWVVPGADLYILNCSYPIRTFSIQQMQDYEEYGQSLLRMKDINDTISIVNSLNISCNNTTSLQGQVYKVLSNNTVSLIKQFKNSNYDETLLTLLKQNLTNDFNKIIKNNSINSINRYLLNENNLKIDRTRVISLNPNSTAYNDSNDYCLQNRLLLEHIFPKMLKNLSYLKKHEYLNLLKMDNKIQIFEKNLEHGETIIFKYYLRPTSLGKKDIRYIIKADGYLDKGIEVIRVSDRLEKFAIEFQCYSKDIILNDERQFTYNIEYLGGNDENSEFFINITPPYGCNLIKASWVDQNKSGFKLENGNLHSLRNVSFSKGRVEKLLLTVKYNKMGLKVSPPSIFIGNFPKGFETDLSVYADYDNPFRIHFEFYTILLTIAAVMISLIVAIFSSIEIYLTRNEIKLTHEEIKLARKQFELAASDRKDSNALISREVRILEKLRRIINKLLR